MIKVRMTSNTKNTGVCTASIIIINKELPLSLAGRITNEGSNSKSEPYTDSKYYEAAVCIVVGFLKRDSCRSQ